MPSDPAWIGVSGELPEYNARELRRLDATLMVPAGDRFGARSGVRPNGQAPVSLASGTITVHDLNAVVYTAAGGTQTGPYRVALQEETHSLDPPDGSNDRIDAVDLVIEDDDEDEGGERRAISVYVTGDPAAAPEPPALTDNSLRLATIDVPSSGGATLTVVAPWTVALGGVLPVLGGASFPSGGAYEGMYADRDGALYRRTGTEWMAVASPHSPSREVFTSSGTFNKADYPWARRVLARVQGGGGSGGGCEATGSGEGSEGGGSGGGGYDERWIEVADLDASETVTVGSGGAGSSSGGSGNSGGTSSFGSHVSATGGGGGELGAATGGSVTESGGNGGQGSGGDLNLRGDDGGAGRVISGSVTKGNFGGGSHLGGVAVSGITGSNGVPGRQYGGGSSGTSNIADASARSSPAGADGVVIVEVY